KPLADGSKAVGLFNRGEDAATIKVNFSDIEVSGSATVRDLWAKKDLGSFEGNYSTQVPKHGVALIKVK
ncbi:MAG: alpha-galactosidase, partial [Acidobacteria bacterium]